MGCSSIRGVTYYSGSSISYSAGFDNSSAYGSQASYVFRGAKDPRMIRQVRSSQVLTCCGRGFPNVSYYLLGEVLQTRFG